MEVKKVPQEILDQLKELKLKKEYLVQEFGKIGIGFEELEERKRTALKLRLEVLEEEKILTENLSKEYGNGTLNVDTGEFQPFTEQLMQYTNIVKEGFDSPFLFIIEQKPFEITEKGLKTYKYLQ